MLVDITRRIEFDAGHRIPNHGSKCRNAHGHRYVLEATLRGKVDVTVNDQAEGMVIDFGSLKDIMTVAVGDPWDHGFLVYEFDARMIGALAVLGTEHKTVMLSQIPTVENLVVLSAGYIAFEMNRRMNRRRMDLGVPLNCFLSRVKLWETPNCFAEWYNPKWQEIEVQLAIDTLSRDGKLAR